jgi:hypothetical protein
MICRTCHGEQWFPPCLDCGGTGIAYCCEGVELAGEPRPVFYGRWLDRSGQPLPPSPMVVRAARPALP